MAVLLVGIYSEGSVWLVREVWRVLRLLGVGSKTKNWVDCNSGSGDSSGGEDGIGKSGKETELVRLWADGGSGTLLTGESSDTELERI